MQIRYPDALPDSLAYTWGDHELRIVVPFDALVAAGAFLSATDTDATQAIKLIETHNYPPQIEVAVSENADWLRGLFMESLHFLNLSDIFPNPKGSTHATDPNGPHAN